MPSDPKTSDLTPAGPIQDVGPMAHGDLVLLEEDFAGPSPLTSGGEAGEQGKTGSVTRYGDGHLPASDRWCAARAGDPSVKAVSLAAKRGIKLSADQAKAAEPGPGRTAIVATAGAGKTMTIASRVAALSLQLGDVGEREIFATSFTREASRNLKERVEFFLGRESRATIATLHSLCARLVIDHYRQLGFRARPDILTASTADMRLKSVVLSQLGSKKLKDVEAFSLDELHSWFYGLDVAAFSPDGLATDSGILFPGPELLPIIQALHSDYHRSNRELAHIDYDEIMTLALELLRANGKKGLSLALPRHIFVDEAQDLNAIQWYIIDTLASQAESLVIIGDDDQSVYCWRGARPSKFIAYVRAAESRHELHKNRRCGAAIVALSEAVVRTIPRERRVDKKLSAERVETGQVYHITTAHYDDFIKSAPARVQAQIGGSGSVPSMSKGSRDLSGAHDQGTRAASKTYDDFAFLFRSSGMAFRKLQGAFLAAKIPFVVRGGKSVFDEDEACYLKAFVTLASRLPEGMVAMEGQEEEAREQMVYWRELMGSLGVSEDAHDRITAAATTESGSLAALREAVSRSRLKDNKAAVLANIEAVGKVREAALQDQSLTLRDMIMTTPVLEFVKRIVMVAGRKAAEARRRRGGLSAERALEIAFALAQDREEGLLSAIEPLYDFRLREASDRFELDESVRTGSHRKYPKVVISTAHSAKGLEWDTVYIMDAVDGAWPPAWSGETDGKSGFPLHSAERCLESEDEEKRLFYVAITRAKNTLAMVNALDMWQGEGQKTVQPARYLTPDLKKRVLRLMAEARSAPGRVVVGRLTEAVLPAKLPGILSSSD